MKKNIFDIIQIGDRTHKLSRAFDYFLVVNIFVNIIVVFLETFDKLSPYFGTFKTIEYVTTVIFLIEYILRIWTADLLYPKESKLKSRLHFLISYDGIVDLFTIIPVFFLTGFIAFRILRVVRIFHLFRINTQSDSFIVIKNVIVKKKNQLLSSLILIFILMLASSLIMYNVEHEAQPEQFSNAFSALWWSVSTMLTVGYGDITPVTILGKIVAIFISFLGVGVIAIPTGIISAGFVEEYNLKQAECDIKPDIDNIGEIEITEDSKYLGKTVYALSKEFQIRAYMVLRNELSILATDNLKLELGDIVIIRACGIEKK